MKVLNSIKAQGAMEYLMTYGWAILVVMIVGVVLWQLGVFGGGPGSVSTATGFGKVKVLEPSIKYKGTTLSFTIINGAGQTLNSVNVSFSGSVCTNIVRIASLDPDEAYEVEDENCAQKSKGESFRVDIYTEYSETVTGNPVKHTERGTIRGVAE